MTKKRWIRNIVVVLVIGIVLLTAAVTTLEPRNELSAVEKGLRVIASPFQHGFYAVSSGIKNFFGTFADYDQLQAENSALKQQMGVLSNQMADLREAELENIRLRELLEFKERNRERFALTAAQIIAENNNNLQHTITLDKGSNDGITSNMTVLNHQGLIGRITSVLPDTCEVVLILDRDGAVGARVWETRETPGVVEGMGSENHLLRMIHLPHDADINVGDRIITSGLDELYPAGIGIGQVVEIGDEPGGLTKQATIEPYVNFYRLEEVFILTGVLSEAVPPEGGEAQ